MSVVITENLVKNYGSVQALRGLNIRAKKGIFGFIGPNGSGKTTTIKILIGALRPDAGKAYILGHDCSTESLEIRRRIGVLHENPSYPKEMTGFDFLTFGGKLYGLSNNEAKSKARQLLETLGLKDAAERNIGGYSAGMKERLGLAQALMGEPELVLLDEPTANLDPIGRMELIEMIGRLHREEGMSFFISSHILPELQKVCDQIGIIHRGVMLEQGSLDEIARKYSGNTFKVLVSNPTILVEELQKLSFVEDASVEGNVVWVSVGKPEMLYDEVARITREKGLQLQMFQQAYGDLENLFKTILERTR